MKKRLTIRFLQRFAVLLVIALSAFSVEGHAQDARRVTVRNATTLSGLISQIEGSSSYRFSWQDDLINAVSFPAVDMVAPIVEVLSAALRTTDIDFSIQQFNVSLTKKVRQSAVPPPHKGKTDGYGLCEGCGYGRADDWGDCLVEGYLYRHEYRCERILFHHLSFELFRTQLFLSPL